jgi:5-(carboxyamino)imidazole ribonucleotide synthase
VWDKLNFVLPEEQQMSVILPGSTIGMLGGGQLGRMSTFKARQLGYNVVVLDPTPNSPCGQVADEQIVAGFDDEAALRQLAGKCDVITYEFENVDAQAVELL